MNFEYKKELKPEAKLIAILLSNLEVVMGINFTFAKPILKINKRRLK
jgi:hypothetical protein